MPDDVLPGSGAASADLPGPIFTVAEARILGLPPSGLRSRNFIPVGRGLREIRGSEPSLPDKVRPLAPAGGDTVASHVTAAVLWGMWLPRHYGSGPLHLSRPLRCARPRRLGVAGHLAPLTRKDVVRVQGMLVTSPAWTWSDLAGLLTVPELVTAGDSLLRRSDSPGRGGFLSPRDPLCGVADLSEVVDRREGCRGIRHAREALALVRPGVDSAPESRLRLLIVAAGLPEPEVNQWIVGTDGRQLSRPDLQYRRRRISLEYEGEHHLLNPDQWHRDIERDDRLRRMGWEVLRFSKQHLRPENQAGTTAKIRKALLSRGWIPGQPA